MNKTITVTQLYFSKKSIIQITLFLFLLLIVMLLSSCSSKKNTNKNNSSTSIIENRIWYKQKSMSIGFKVLIENENKGWAISQGGLGTKGGFYSYDGTKWNLIYSFPFSIYPHLKKYNENTLWYFTHDSQAGTDRPRHYKIEDGVKTEITIPKLMLDSTLYLRLKSVAVLKNGTAWLVGSQGSIFFFNKKKWQQVKSPVQKKKADRNNIFEGDLTSVSMVNENFGFAVGITGIIIKYTNGKWSRIKSPTDKKLNSVFMLDENHGWAVGLDGTILKYENNKWTISPSPKFANLKSVKFANKNLGWIVGLENTLLEYNGKTWKEISFGNQINSNLLDLDFVKYANGKLDFWLATTDGIYTTAQSCGFSFSNVTSQSSLREEGKCGHFFNANSDEYPDLIIQKDIGPPIFYLNKKGIFEEHTLPTNSKEQASAICTGDVNNDGNVDVFIYSKYNEFSLLLGKGDGKFLNYTKESGITFEKMSGGIVSAKFVDFNNDGNLELYLSANRFNDYLFVNDGTGHFVNKFNESNIKKYIPFISYGATFADFNNDSLTDVFIIYPSLAKGKNGILFINEGNLKFSEKHIPACEPKTSNYSVSCIANDFNNDDKMDLLIFNEKNNLQLLLNNGFAEFENVSNSYGLNENIISSTGILNCADVNNDGRKDVFVNNKLLLNFDNNKLVDISKNTGIDFSGNPAFTDYDNDGDYDLFIGKSSKTFGKGVRAALFRNNMLDKKSAKVVLYPDWSNRSAIGTKLTLYQNGKIFFNKTLGIGSSPLVSNDISSIIIPVDAEENKLEIIFPSGKKEICTNISANDRIAIYESGLISHYFVLMYKSLLRTHLLINVISEVIKLAIFLLLISVIIFKLKNYSKLRYSKNPFFITIIIFLYLLTIHLNILHGFWIYTTLSYTVPTFFGIMFLYTSAKLIDKKESRYIAGYKLIEIVGMGGMGKVFRAIDVNKKREVALKVLNPEIVKDDENKKRLLNEGKILASFNHPAIVKVFEIGETEKHTYVAMEFLSGGTLYEHINKYKLLSVNEVLQIALQICEGLKVIHNSDCIHRDLKSHNIMFDSKQNIKIMDFGLSKAPLVSTMTTLGTVVGTLGYVAPEQVTGTECDFKTDIFSFGVMMYEMATGKLPFNGENEIAVIHSIFNKIPEPPSNYNKLISKNLDKIILKMLAKEPSERFQTVTEIKKSLKEIIENENNS